MLLLFTSIVCPKMGLRSRTSTDGRPHGIRPQLQQICGRNRFGPEVQGLKVGAKEGTVEEVSSVVILCFAQWTVYFAGFILCRHDMRKGDLLVLSCARVLRVFRGNVCSSLWIGGGI